MRAYASDLRGRVLRARGQGLCAEEEAKVFSLSKGSVERYWKRYLETGEATAGKMGGHRTSKLAPHDATLRKWIGERPDLTLGELRQRCQEQLKVRLGTTALWHRLERLGLSYKKNAARRRTDPARTGGRAHPLVDAAGAVGRPAARVH